MPKELIGIMGGSFDPIRQDQLRMAIGAMEAAHLNLVYLFPFGDNTGKPYAAGKEDRWKMTVTACTLDQRLIPSRAVLDGDFPFFSINMALSFKKDHPDAVFFCILSADEFLTLYRRPNLNKLFRFCAFLICPSGQKIPADVFRREKDRLSSLGARIITVRLPSVSSSLKAEAFPGALYGMDLFSPVREFCELKGLYGMNCREENAEVWIEKLFHELNARRFAHSLSVAEYSLRLARIHRVNLQQAEQAGLLHDCAKCKPLKEMQRIAIQHSLTNDSAILESNALMHSLVGAWVARNEYGMADPEVLEAISYHNTGHAGMSRLAMCVCLADSIEPTRGDYPHLEQIRALSEISLERALLMSLEETASYVRSRGKFLHPRTQETISWLKTLPEVCSSVR